MICVFICLSLLTMIAALHLLAKINKENLGPFLKWTSYFILLVATGVLICQIICSTRMCMMHNGKCNKMEQCSGGMKCSDKNEKCKGGNKKCKGEKKCARELMLENDSACCKNEVKESEEVEK